MSYTQPTTQPPSTPSGPPHLPNQPTYGPRPPYQPMYGPQQPYQPTSGPQQPPQATREPSGISPSAEALGYAGGILTTIGVLYGLSDIWVGLNASAQTGLLAVATTAMAAAATVVGAADRTARRLSTTLWLLAGLSGTTTAYLVVESVADLGADAGLLAAGSTAAVGATAMWRRTDRAIFGAIAYIAALLAVLGAVGVAGGDLTARALALWAGGVAAIAASAADVLPSHRVGVSLGALTAMGSAQAIVVDSPTSGVLLGLGVAVALGLCARLRVDTQVYGWMALVLAVFLPQAAWHWVPEDLGWTAVTLLLGVSMLGGCIGLVMRSRAVGPDAGSSVESTSPGDAG